MFGINLAGFNFSEPRTLRLASVFAPAAGGVYAILVQDRSWQPRPFGPIYIGRSQNFAARGLWRDHHAFDRWARVAGGSEYLYGAFHVIPAHLSSWIEFVEATLINKYDPICNRTNPIEAILRGLAGNR